MKSEQLNTVEMTRRIRDQMYEETKALDADELIRYFNERSKAAATRVEECEAEEGSRLTLR
jgi:hypothetical protein